MKCYLVIESLLKSNYWRIVKRGILGSSIASAILTQGIFTFAQTEPASKLTLYVPRTNEVIDANTWCQGSDAVGTGRPFGLNQVRFYTDRTDPENREYLIGCITNNTQQIVEPILVTYQGFTSSGFNNKFGVNSLSMSTLEPGETGFFRTQFTIAPETTNLEIDLQRPVQQGQTTTYEPVERLVIQRRQ
jgi:hypothetical protein